MGRASGRGEDERVMANLLVDEGIGRDLVASLFAQGFS
jgi:hypothetical protein